MIKYVLHNSGFLILLFLIGCGGEAHKTFTKISNVEIRYLNELPKFVGLDNENYKITPEDIRSFYSNYFVDINSTDKYITVLFTHKGSDWGGSGAVGRVLIDLCRNGIPPDIDKHPLPKAVPVFEHAYYKVALILTPSILRKEGLLNNNRVKDDVCVYPGDNLPFGTMTKDDYFTLTKDELDNVLEQY